MTDISLPLFLAFAVTLPEVLDALKAPRIVYGCLLAVLILNALREWPIGPSIMVRDSVGRPLSAVLLVIVWAGIAWKLRRSYRESQEAWER